MCLKERERDLIESWTECIWTLLTSPLDLRIQMKWWNTSGKCLFCLLCGSEWQRKSERVKERMQASMTVWRQKMNLDLQFFFCHFHLIAIWTCLQYLTLSLSHSHTLPPLSVFISDAHPLSLSHLLKSSSYFLVSYQMFTTLSEWTYGSCSLFDNVENERNDLRESVTEKKKVWKKTLVLPSRSFPEYVSGEKQINY